jgi:hypothetical protein
MDAGNFHLKQFKIHDFNAKSINAVTKEADRLRTDFELESCIATISGLKQKQSSKCLEDPNDWEAVETMIERCMKEGIKRIHVEHVVTYIKKRRILPIAQKRAMNSDESEEEVKEIQLIKKRKV